MWQWILENLTRAVKSINLSKNIIAVDKEDIVSNVCLYLCEHQDIAKEIYEHKKIPYLYTLAKREVYEQQSKMFFDNKVELSRYQRIIAVCEKYGIEPKVENAYKISAVLDDQSNFSITGVMIILSADTPLHNGYLTREVSFDEWEEKFND